jgi:hypothetical protein
LRVGAGIAAADRARRTGLRLFLFLLLRLGVDVLRRAQSCAQTKRGQHRTETAPVQRLAELLGQAVELPCIHGVPRRSWVVCGEISKHNGTERIRSVLRE